MSIVSKSHTKARKKRQEIKGTLDQLAQWRKDNCIGFDLWTMKNEEKGFTLTATQTKFGVAIIQTFKGQDSYVIFTHKESY